MPKKPKEMERILLKAGWRFDSQSGSHRHYEHPEKPGKITIPFHSKELSRKTENSILRQAGLQ